ncbi:C40 family peptidase [Promicromonospora iranensis]|uniref:Cell wall-associated NlpC family hydrolase n=1 Tax=Promicromonospora iranensis TaxID=1105144 RepID=A0ABU2CPE1_9MICO|nr:NlpC/P60 family protein [Promicromonospora iranensis]MDR7383209.1 cell wall-associated NlpC family hydrolase [Promicromonospora iranensis]
MTRTAARSGALIAASSGLLATAFAPSAHAVMGDGSNRLASVDMTALTQEARKELAAAPAVQVANDARLDIESKAVKVTPAPEPEPEPEPEPVVETTTHPEPEAVTEAVAEEVEPATPDYASDGSIGAQAVAIAMQYIGIAYTYGGESPGTGFDCSGLIKYVYAQLGVTLPHSSSSMVAAGYQVASPIPGDIVWTQGHVSLYAGDGMVVEAANYGTPVRHTAQWQDYAVYIRPY